MGWLEKSGPCRSRQCARNWSNVILGLRTIRISNFSIPMLRARMRSVHLIASRHVTREAPRRLFASSDPLRVGKIEGECGDGNVEAPSMRINHPVFADHEPTRGGQRAARGVTEGLPGGGRGSREVKPQSHSSRVDFKQKLRVDQPNGPRLASSKKAASRAKWSAFAVADDGARIKTPSARRNN